MRTSETAQIFHKRNYQQELDSLIDNIKGNEKPPALVLHSCCAPCSSYVLEYLSKHFSINIVYYNPNISSEDEFKHRLSEQERLIRQMDLENPVTLTRCDYVPQEFYEIARGFEDCRERGERCRRCYRLRLEYTARMAKAQGADFFASTLTLSPLKDARTINEIGEELSKKYGVRYLCSDFKKKDGYKRSIELSRKYDLYRQDFCGCVYSKRRLRDAD